MFVALDYTESSLFWNRNICQKYTVFCLFPKEVNGNRTICFHDKAELTVDLDEFSLEEDSETHLLIFIAFSMTFMHYHDLSRKQSN